MRRYRCVGLEVKSLLGIRVELAEALSDREEGIVSLDVLIVDIALLTGMLRFRLRASNKPTP